MARGSVERGADRAPQAARPLTARWAGALAVLAALNLAAGLVLSAIPDRRQDFDQALGWARQWTEGADVYGPDSIVNYPPNAIVMLAALLPLPGGAAIWIAANVILAIVFTTLAASRAGIAPALALLALPAFRTPNQLSLAAFVPAFGGVLAGRSRPLASGALIGFSLAKPHLGLPALLWAVATRRWKTASLATGVAAALAYAHCAVAGVSALDTAWRYADALARRHNAPDFGAGETDLAFMGTAAFGWPPVLVQSAVFALLCAVAWFVFRRRGDEWQLYAALSLASLLGFRHLNYDLVLAAPALIWLWRHQSPRPKWIAGVCLLFLVASLPTVWRRVEEVRAAAPALEPWVMHASRGALAVLFAAVLGRWPGRPRDLV